MEEEAQLHINCLELLAATFAIQTFAKEITWVTILLKLDNTSAVVAYINNLGGTQSLRNQLITAGGQIPICSSNRCVPPGLVSHEGVCKSTIVSDQQGPVTSSDTAGPGDAIVGRLSLGIPASLVDFPRLINPDHPVICFGDNQLF